jgi:hypothetical protein
MNAHRRFTLHTGMARVSVIVPVFNSAAFVGGALRSVFAQSFRGFEVIVVDDGSEDREALDAVLGEWQGRVTCVRQPNGGPARARNTGIRRATGELVAFLDADDEWLPDKLAKQVAYFDRYPETGLLHTGIVGEPPSLRLAGPPRAMFCELFHTAFFINTLTVMVPRRVLDEVGLFDERREVHIEDWDLWLRIAARHPLGYLAETFAYHRPGGLMSSQIDRTYAAQALVVDKNKALCAVACATHRAAPERCERARRHVLHRDWGYDRLEGGDRMGAREQLSLALGYAPHDPRTRVLYWSTFVGDGARNAARRLFGTIRRGRAPRQPGTEAAPSGLASARPGASLLHDTLYRRARRRTITTLHQIDDTLTKMTGSRRRILFEAASPMSFAMYRPIYERLRGDARLELLFTSFDRTWAPARIFGEAAARHRVLAPGAAAWTKVDAYINADLWDMTWLRRHTRRIHLFHGVAGKYGLDAPMELAPAIAGFDCLMFANADRRHRYVDAGLVPDDQIRAALVGYPKVDCLVDGSFDRDAILQGLLLDPRQPVVIYAPTWSPYSSLNTSGEAVIDGLAAAGVQVIVKLHDRSYDPAQRGSGGIDWHARLRRYDSHPLVRVVRDADGCPFMAAADAMVSDHSSIAFEYMLLDRPIVTVDCPALIARAAISADKVGLMRSATRVASDPSDVVRLVIAELASPGGLSAARRRVSAELFHRPGTATDRAVALIYTLLELPALADAAAAVQAKRVVATAG